MTFSVEDLSNTPNALASHYSRFRVQDGLVLTGHSHQAWPDVALHGQIEAFDDAAELLGAKWDRAFAKADAVRAGFRRLLGEPDAEITLGANTHELVLRFLSCLDLRSRPKLVTTDGEFHTLRRQLGRLAEEGIELVRLPAEPVDTLATRLAEATDDRTAAVLVSSVLFETSRIVPGLGDLAAACTRRGAELLVDTYHMLGVVPMSIAAERLESAWLVGGGYKYLQLGEGNCFLRLPGHALDLRPVITGWYSEFGEIVGESGTGGVTYIRGADRFAGATYDPTSNYRAASVFEFFTEQGLSPEFLRRVSLHKTGLLADLFDGLDLPDEVITRDRAAPRTAFGGFLALRSPRAAELRAELAQRGVATDSRGSFLRFGPAPYLSDAQLESAMGVLGEVVRARS